jgi:hypothetical protein
MVYQIICVTLWQRPSAKLLMLLLPCQLQQLPAAGAQWGPHSLEAMKCPLLS